MPQWYGTPWAFDGISEAPRKNYIACGYFVSTTLKHVGFNLNRYKLAQQAASVVIDVLCGNNKAYSTDKSALINKLKAKNGNRLYVVGLDYHVGFIAVQNNEVYFIHSDYFKNKVVKEFAFKSQGFSATNSYVYGEITNNSSLLNKWKLNQLWVGCDLLQYLKELAICFSPLQCHLNMYMDLRILIFISSSFKFQIYHRVYPLSFPAQVSQTFLDS